MMRSIIFTNSGGQFATPRSVVWEKGNPVVVDTVKVGVDKKGWGGGFYRCTVMAEFSDGSYRDVVTYYTDEHWYNGSEFFGRTYQECSDLATRRDIAYLQR